MKRVGNEERWGFAKSRLRTDFFDENRSGPIRPMGREMKKQRVVYKYDFFNKNRTGPIRTHLVPIASRRRHDAQPAQPQTEADILFEKTLEAMERESYVVSWGNAYVMRLKQRWAENGPSLLVSKNWRKGIGFMAGDIANMDNSASPSNTALLDLIFFSNQDFVFHVMLILISLWLSLFSLWFGVC